MKQVKHISCGGTGYLSQGSICGFCGGTGMMWVDEDNELEPSEQIATVIFISVWGAVAYWGITNLHYEWYWPVGAGFLIGKAVQKLLLGPLYFCLVIIRWVLIVVLGAGLLLFGAEVIRQTKWW